MTVWQYLGTMLNVLKMSQPLSIAVSRCHVKCFKDESVLESIAASR